MTDIAATDVTFTIIKRNKLDDNRQMVIAKLVVGNSTLTYPSGGIPITIGNMGFRNAVDSLIVYGNGASAYTFTYDPVNKKIIMATAAAEVGSVAIAAQTLYVEVKGW